MDEVESVVLSVRDVVEVGRAGEWFEVVCRAFDACRGDWPALKELLAARAGEKSFGRDVAETFVRFVDDRMAFPMSVMSDMCARRQELPRLYEDLIARTDQETTAETVQEWDEEAAAQWYEYLTTSNTWVGWAGGGEAEWTEFTEWFLYFAELQHVREQAALLVRRVENDPDGITAGFAKLGIVTAEPAAAPVAAAGWGKRTATRYVELTSGKGWAGWTGDDSDWDLFTQWFLYYAGQEGDHENAQLFLDTVAESRDKIKAFADQGITIGVSRAEVPPQPKPAAVEYSPLSAEQLEQLGISEADLDAATRQIDALLASLGEAD
jgi:hypothetical protein